MDIVTFRQDPAILKKVARLMKTAGHPARLMIVDLLLEKGKMPVKDIQATINISQSNASQHLKALEDLGVLASERDGKKIFYSIDNEQIGQLIRCVHDCATC